MRSGFSGSSWCTAWEGHQAHLGWAEPTLRALRCCSWSSHSITRCTESQMCPALWVPALPGSQPVKLTQLPCSQFLVKCFPAFSRHPGQWHHLPPLPILWEAVPGKHSQPCGGVHDHTELLLCPHQWQRGERGISGNAANPAELRAGVMLHPELCRVLACFAGHGRGTSSWGVSGMVP